jgi:hypothetical protein
VLGLLLTRSVLAQSADGAAPAAPKADTTTAALHARELFEHGLALARAERYEEARAQFRLAYQASPHYLVLYNIAQCERLLGQLEAAAESLQRFLQEGGSAVAGEARRAAELELSELRQRLAERAGPASPPQLQAAPVALPKHPPSRKARSSTPGWVLGGSGLALLGTALGLYLYNDSRYGDWQRRDGALSAVPDLELSLARDPQVWARARRNNELLRSIHRRDALSGVTAGVGVLALAAGAWQLLQTDSGANLTAGPGPEFSWSMRW